MNWSSFSVKVIVLLSMLSEDDPNIKLGWMTRITATTLRTSG